MTQQINRGMTFILTGLLIAKEIIKNGNEIMAFFKSLSLNIPDIVGALLYLATAVFFVLWIRDIRRNARARREADQEKFKIEIVRDAARQHVKILMAIEDIFQGLNEVREKLNLPPIKRKE